MTAHRSRPLVAAVLALALAGCSVVATDGTAPSAAPSTRAVGAASGAPGAPVNDVVTRALKDVERFWASSYPSLSGGDAFQPVRGGYHPYTRTDPPPACGEQPAEYQPNAFYCPAGDFIAWDAQVLIPQLNSEFGPLLVGVVLAHEYGHAIQTRLHLADQPTVVLEQQADCFAGAWVADVLAGRSTAYSGITPEQLDNTVAGMLMLRDQPGTSAAAPEAHGNAFDRIRAMQDGVEDGPSECAAYRTDNVPVTEVPFSTQEEADTGGDLPYDEAVSSLAADAESYWDRTYPELANQQWQRLRVETFGTQGPPACQAPDASAGGSAFYCPDGDFVAFDNEQLGPQLYQQIGDNAVGILIGNLFARAAQDRRGASTQDKVGQLTVDCLTGTWTGDLLRRDETANLRLSPGDLDEAVTALLAFGRADEQVGISAFDRIAAYRDGVIDGVSSCS